jgi:uncharacterized short protein YbdD (DUF466 family)
MQRDLNGWLARCLATIRRTAGMPDYAAYTAHRLRVHPGDPVPSEREYFAQFVAARYSDSPTRCC